MDKDTRNFIFNTTQAIRRLLEEEFARQLEGTFDVHDDGRVAEQPGPQLTPAERLVRQRIVEAIQHRRAAGESSVDSVRGFQSEAVFTFLNRLAALKMMEARGLVLPCVSQGDQSQGFKEFSGLAPGLIELPDKGYRLYLECLFDEIGREVGVLFDRTDSASLLWPRRKALEAVLEKLNHPALADVWAEDETIGWIYQYYNDPEERRAMRDESSAPRNSRELAVRNQFFTPRYVVEFLTDNTLGRLWHEMTQGRTRLREQCRYMVRRPDEVFFGHMTEAAQECPAQGVIELAKQLQQGDATSFAEFTTDDCSVQRMIDMAHTVNGYARHPGNEQTWQWVAECRRNVFLPAAYTGATTQDILDALFLECRADRHGGDGSIYRERWFVNACNEVRRRALRSREANLPQAELLQQPVFIPFRPLKDPRTIRILDPACGSMHFGLYAFDLLQTIYEEALDSELGQRDKLLTDYGWREDAPNTIRPASVHLKPTVPAWSEYHSKDIPTDRAWIVVAADSDGGDGVLKGQPYVVEDTVKFRVPFAHRVKLSAFDYAKALADGWCDAEAGEAFLRASKCFGFEAAVTVEEAEAAYFRDIPRLIIEHNLHGIDIDPRAAQIAGLALWLRAQKAWQQLGVKPVERPVIRRSNIVCAEPMPGEKELLKEFVEREFPVAERSVFLRFLTAIFDKMQLAGEAGSLLKIEEEIRIVIAEAKQQWKEGPKFEQGSLFADLVPAKPQAEMKLDLTGITDEQFWERAEERIYEALRDYAEQTESGGGFQRRLFAEDAARGFAFIDVCRKRYDVALMNPPFGDATIPAVTLLGSSFVRAGNDIGAAFVADAATRWCPKGRVGVLLSTAPWFKPAFEKWRDMVFFGGRAQIQVAAHLSGEVLDGATVNASPFIIDGTVSGVSTVVRLTRSRDLEGGLGIAISALRAGEANGNLFLLPPAEAGFLPNKPFCYWASPMLRRSLALLPAFEGSGGFVRTGLQTSDEPRFCRAWWEIPCGESGWQAYSKSSPFSPFWDDYAWCELIGDGLKQVGAFPKSFIRGAEFFGRAGVTYPSKSVLGFNVRLHPSGCGFAHSACVAFSDVVSPSALLGFLGSRPVEYLISLFIGDLQGKAGVHPNQYEVGTIQRLPWPGLVGEAQVELESAARRSVDALRSTDSRHEMTRSFLTPIFGGAGSIRTQATSALGDERTAIKHVGAARAEMDTVVLTAYGFSAGDTAELESAFTDRIPPASGRWRGYFGEDGADYDIPTFAHITVSWALGVSLGRWDIRYATGKKAAPELPDPFASLPECPPGQLQNAQGLPARPEDVPAAYPVRIPWDGILVDDPNHPLDIIERVREVLRAIWTGSAGSPPAEAIEHEACEVLDVKSLRDYFRKPTGFFADHLQRYSKSRRQAPIYWSLSSPHGLYTVWLYYHRLTADTLFTVLRDHVKPKLEYEERRAFQLRQESGPTPSPSQRRDLAEADELVEDLRAFRDELNRVAPLFRPNLNDGVIINHAPLWHLAGLPKWRKDCQAVWDALANGDYDWAHLALHLWPERVIPKCATDRSLAIAHGLDEVFWEEFEDKPGKPKKWRAKKISDTELQKLIAARTSPAVKAALESLGGASPSEGTPRRGRKKASA